MIQLTSDHSRRPIWTLVCWIVVGGFVATVFFAQIWLAKQAAAAPVTDTTPNLALDITARVVVGQSVIMQRLSASTEPANRNLDLQLQNNLQQLAVSPPDKLKAIIAIEEISGAARAIRLLDAEEDYFTGHPIIRRDALALKSIYNSGPGSISAAQAQAIKEHLGWFGELAVTQGLANGDPARAAQLNAAKKTYLTAISLGVGVVVLLGLGFLLLALLVVLFSLGKLKFLFQPGSFEPGPVFLESFAMWGIAYLILSFSIRRYKAGHSPLVFECIFVVVTALVACWPMVRGISFQQLRRSLGWYRGRGFVIEMAAGLLGYVAGLPIMLVGVLLTLLLSKLGHANPTHPIQQEFAGPLPVSKIVSLLIAISVGAPLLEETMFRGALYYHLRRRWRPWFSAGVVALIFAAIHPQGWAGIPVLASIALTLALLREWRGNLIASVTAHGINNGIVLLAVVLMLK